jgi:hypothetical protein
MKPKVKFQLLRAEDVAKWDELVEASAEGTLFITDVFLKALGIKYCNYFVLKGSQVCAGVSFCVSDTVGDAMLLPDLLIYNGIIFQPPAPGQNPESVLSDQFEITEFIITEMAKTYKQIQWALVPQLKDLRPFLWFNYHCTDAERFALALRYTSYLDLSSIGEGEETGWPLFKNLSYSRRQEVRYARRDGVRAQLSADVGVLTDLYVQTMNHQNIAVEQKTIASMQAVMRALMAQKKGFLFIVPNCAGLIVSAAFFACDRKRAYYLWGANHLTDRTRYSGTIVLWDAFIHLHGQGLQAIDLEGVNSPYRGWFKLSFGGSLCPYYRVTLRQAAVGGNVV